jgi:hypothetical protein
MGFHHLLHKYLEWFYLSSTTKFSLSVNVCFVCGCLCVCANYPLLGQVLSSHKFENKMLSLYKNGKALLREFRIQIIKHYQTCVELFKNNWRIWFSTSFLKGRRATESFECLLVNFPFFKEIIVDSIPIEKLRSQHEACKTTQRSHQVPGPCLGGFTSFILTS